MLYDLLKTRRSIRKFQKREVEKDKVDILLKSALLSPTSRSGRPWEFIAVTDRVLLEKLSKSKEHGSSFLADAPLGIVVIADHEKSDVWVEDASIASIIIQLSAQSIGLGTCWIQVRERFAAGGVKAEDYIRETLLIPDRYSVECIVAAGYPAEEKSPYTDGELLYDRLHFDKYMNK
ncbi:MAG: nitroreductase family protein [Bacillota bacterium]|nr:nitroreductase family protein [Bacillota bacterium]